jgi:hypothetical protein
MGLASGVRGRTWRKKRKMLGEKDFGLRRTGGGGGGVGNGHGLWVYLLVMPL